ncbi:hypothetical protein N8I74_17555 [Chitiniphilus purpureus]|uniref:Uncharacterized protein n=1 Tax=Chitiniphilus purpureus TaxID=2981137 RepID=A0ABY6DL63_9NEIS|nr:hypothetical protein [Chitiniphilus sp. CD1]UXY15097.1 hypothetical protein N8I74_17555 [Chitiniphilus sp. CD1]
MHPIAPERHAMRQRQPPAAAVPHVARNRPHRARTMRRCGKAGVSLGWSFHGVCSQQAPIEASAGRIRLPGNPAGRIALDPAHNARHSVALLCPLLMRRLRAGR